MSTANNELLVDNSFRARRKRFKKAFFNHSLVLAFLTWLAAYYIRLCHYTARKRYHIAPSAEPYICGEKNMILTFWHGRLLMTPMLIPRKRRMNLLISSHQDGRLISLTMGCFGFHTITGSTGRSGTAALRKCIAAIKNGDNIGLAPDGPRGPALQLSMGTIILAKLSGAPIVPVTIACRAARRLNSWDRFLLVFPFSRLDYAAGDPIFIPPEASDETLETLRKQVEATLITLMEDTDSLQDKAQVG